MSIVFHQLTPEEYFTLLHYVRTNKIISENTIGEDVNGDFKGKHFIFKIGEQESKALFFKSKHNPTPNIFDELGKYVTSVISKTTKVQDLYDSFADKIISELDKKNIARKDYVIYVKGSLVARNKFVKMLPLIKNINLRKIFKNVICFNKEHCDNSVLRQSDFDVNLVIFNQNKIIREKIKNAVVNILVKLKDDLDTKEAYLEWIHLVNKAVQKAILESLKKHGDAESEVASILDETIKAKAPAPSVKESKDKWSKVRDTLLAKKDSLLKYPLGKYPKHSSKKSLFKKTKNQAGGKSRKRVSKRKTMKKTNEGIRNAIELKSFVPKKKLIRNIGKQGTTQELMQNPKLRFVVYQRAKELFKNIDQTRKSFYINNLKNQDFTFQTDLLNTSHLDKYLPNYDLKSTQTFISLNENIDMKLEKKNFKRKVHFDLYRLKLNLCFYMKYIGSAEFKRNIGGELIDVSFPYADNAYLGKDKESYKSKLMKSKEYKGLDEYNIWGVLVDLVETIEIESINISKPHKFEKRINRFIMLRFLEYWLRMPFRINHTLNARSYYVYNSSIHRSGHNFNQFFRQTLHVDYEFDRIKNCLEKNQNIDIYRLYRKFLGLEPYQTLFKVPRKDLDKALGFTDTEINHLPTLLKNHKELYSIFFDLDLSLVAGNDS